VRKLLYEEKSIAYLFFLTEYCESWLDALLHTPLSFSVSGDGDLEVKVEDELCCSIIFSFFFDALLLMLINEFIICNQIQLCHVELQHIFSTYTSYFFANTILLFFG